MRNYKMKDKKSSGPKILLLDIETSPMLGFCWSLWENNIALNQLEKDWHVLSWSAKWLDKKEIIYKDQRNAKNIEDDKVLLKGIWELLDEADVVIGQNSKRFDIKKLNARFIMNGMAPPSPFRQIDTMILAKRHFAFTSNKLEYLSNNLCKNFKKLKTKKFQGFELWKACLDGNIQAWKEMEAYNKMDVLALEELYKKLAPWDNSVNLNVYGNPGQNICSCGNAKFESKGYTFTNTGKFKRMRCTKCRKSFKLAENLLTKEHKKELLR